MLVEVKANTPKKSEIQVYAISIGRSLANAQSRNASSGIGGTTVAVECNRGGSEVRGQRQHCIVRPGIDNDPDTFESQDASHGGKEVGFSASRYRGAQQQRRLTRIFRTANGEIYPKCKMGNGDTTEECRYHLVLHRDGVYPATVHI